MPFFLFVLFALFLFWLVTLPLRFAFRLVFGVGGILLRLLLAPVILLVFAVVAVLALVAMVVAAIAAVLAPLVPIALVALAGWVIYRFFVPRSVPVA